MDIFGNNEIHEEGRDKLMFWIKQHHAIKAGLHFDLRLQFAIIKGGDAIVKWAKSFVLKPGPSMDPGKKILAILVDDHEVRFMRREGTVLEKDGIGAMVHFDEGFFTIPGCKSLSEFVKAFNKGMNEGNLLLLFDGYKIKGLFRLKRVKNDNNRDWVFEKRADDYARTDDILDDTISILSNQSLNYYMDEYKDQTKKLSLLSPEDQKKFIGENYTQNFKHKNLKLPDRPDKILP